METEASKHPSISKVYLFGSVARGTAKEGSNVDLRVELDPRKNTDVGDLEAFCESIKKLTGREVDIVSSRVQHNKSLEAAIEREKVLIYERSQRFPLPSV